MDIIERIHEEEAEIAFFLQEAEQTGEFDMDQSVIRQFQDEAAQAYERLPQPEAAHNAQVVMLAEIALQQARIADALEAIAKRLDGWNTNGVPVENVGGH
jgi:hypothetical protein